MLSNFVEQIATRIIVLEGWRASLLAVVAGAASSLSLAPYHLFPILFVTIPVFVWLLDGSIAPTGRSNPLRRSWPAFKTGWLFGFGYFLSGFWWVGKAFLVDADDFLYLLPFAVMALPAGLALFWGSAAALARLIWIDGWLRLLGFAALFTLFEWLRGTILTGLPWNVPGYAAMPTPLFMQSAGVVGLYGMTFFTLLIATVPAAFAPSVRSNFKRAGWPLLPLAAILCVVHIGYGFWVLSGADNATVDGVRLRLVQPALDQREKWDPALEADIMARYFDLSNADKGPQQNSIRAFTHVIWPESSFPFILTQRRDQLAAISRLLPSTTTLITGAMRLEKPTDADSDPKVFNSIFALNGNGEIIAASDKTRLLPFGEFLPFQSFLESLGLRQLTQLRGGFAAGTRRSNISLPGTPTFLPLICYEIIYSGAVRAEIEDGKPRAQWIVNLTNDAWFGLTAGPYQHAHQAQVRAVEEGLPVVRAANNGISFVADAYGRIAESLALGQHGVVDSALPVARSSTLFNRVGNRPIIFLVCLIVIGLIVIDISSPRKL